MAALPGVNRVVLVGSRISPGNPVTKPDGTVVRAMWGGWPGSSAPGRRLPAPRQTTSRHFFHLLARCIHFCAAFTKTQFTKLCPVRI